MRSSASTRSPAGPTARRSPRGWCSPPGCPRRSAVARRASRRGTSGCSRPWGSRPTAGSRPPRRSSRPSGWTRSTAAGRASYCWRTSAARSWKKRSRKRSSVPRSTGPARARRRWGVEDAGAVPVRPEPRGTRTPGARTIRHADARGDHGRGVRTGFPARARAHVAPDRPRGRADRVAERRRGRGVPGRRRQPRRALAHLVRPPRRGRGLRAAGDRGPHDEHLRARGVPPALRDLGGVPRDDRRCGCGWLPRRAGGAPVDHGLRRSHLGELLRELEVEGLIVTRLPNVRYLTGFGGATPEVGVAGGGSAVFLPDGRYGAQSSHEVPDLPRTVYRQGVPQPLVEACRALGIGRAGFERHALTYEGWEQLTDRAEGLELVPVGPEAEGLRRTKDPEEIALVARAQGCADRAFEAVVLGGGLREGVTERAFALVLETAMVEAGAEDRAFDSIVAFGDHAAEPHHHPTDRELARGDMVKLDFGARADGYHSDITRTVAFGDPGPRLREIRDVVATAQRAGIDAVRPGVSTVEVDAAARSVIVDAGPGESLPAGGGARWGRVCTFRGWGASGSRTWSR